MLKKNEIILSSYEIGTFIPRYTGKKVFLGHWAQTIFAEAKSKMVGNFYANQMTNEQEQIFLKNNNIKYIFYGPNEKMISPINLDNLGQEVFRNQQVSIFKIN